MELLTEAREWPEVGRSRRAGVSSFGISGTNAHVILEQAPTPPPNTDNSDEDTDHPFVSWVMSARSPEALRAQAARLLDHLSADSDLRPIDISYSLATTRESLPHRAVVVGRAREQLLEGVAALAAGEPGENLVEDVARDPGKTVFVFPGQGSQWSGMAAGLWKFSTVFREQMQACADALEPHVDWSLRDAVFSSDEDRIWDRVDVVQPMLWAVMISLAKLWRSYGVEPAAVVGHSQGEIAAACVAGSLSLSDGARLVALRSRLVAELLSGHGGMASVSAPVHQVRERIGQWSDRLDIAAVNSRSSVVVSGETQALEELLTSCERDGLRARRIAVDYASHSPQVERLRDNLLTALAEVRPRVGDIPQYSTVTGDVLTGEELTAEYWYHNLRRTVGFGDAIERLAADGHGAFVECSPHPVLTPGIEETLNTLGHNALVTGTLRRDEGGLGRFLLALAGVYAAGREPNWEKVFAGTNPRRVALPTYAFQRQRYWLEASSPTGDPAAIGLGGVDHSVWAVVAELPDSGGVLFSGRLSCDTHPWLADHTVDGAVLLPGTAFLDLALQACDQVGCDRVAELTIEVPLILPECGAVYLRAMVGEADPEGARSITIHSRPEGASRDQAWTRHATGYFIFASPPAGPDLTEWPPEGAERVAVDRIYEDFAELALEYGPRFRGLRAAWRRGSDVFAEVALPTDDSVDGYAIHPALLDAAVHAVALGQFVHRDKTDVGPRLPFSWSGVSVHAVEATQLRVRISTAGRDAVALDVADGTGAPVASIESLALRSVASDRLRATVGGDADSLFTVNWLPVSLDRSDQTGSWALLDESDVLVRPLHAAGLRVERYGDIASLLEASALPDVVVAPVRPHPGDRPVAARDAVAGALVLARAWIGDARLASTLLVVVTQGAIAVGEGESADPASAAVWGLLRSAQSENPDRIVLVDLDQQGPALDLLPAAIASDEHQVALRQTEAFVPRLARVPVSDTVAPTAYDSEGTVLVTGASGVLGRMVARHLVAAHNVRWLLLVSRRGAGAEGAVELTDELAGMGASVTWMACDVADRAALAEALDQIPPEHPLRAVVHTAGVLDDGVISALSPERLDRVFRPKMDAAVNLHELTKDMDLSAFLLFSSAAGTFGNPGQGAYAAANVFLDAFAGLRRSLGLPAVSLAWGLWAETSAMTDQMSGTDRDRMRRSGVAALSSEDGLSLLDSGMASGLPVVVPVRLDLAAVRARAATEGVPVLLRSLVRPPMRRAVAASDGLSGLAQQLAELPPQERVARVVDMVRTQAAAVLGHRGPTAVAPDRAFKDLGFDSLTGIELRNRLAKATGLRLPATLVFDHPTALALAEHLCNQLTGRQRTGSGVRITGSTDEPIAIVGMACRYPGGVTSPEDLWHLVDRGVDAISAFPLDRGWERPAADEYLPEGGFLHDAAEFDPEFFGISPREALSMDPQQRLLLETSWEVVERAGIDPKTLRGSRTGVFAGLMYHDYTSRFQTMPADASGYLSTGTSGSVASGRIAYAFGFEGPAVTLDTACSSSLVALHVAAQSLRSGECDLALAGGVTVMCTPTTFSEFSRQGGMAADARCKPFAAAADGATWGEGVGMLLVERLSDALRNGHRVHAIVRGSAVNQDGASNGLTAPNGPAQERVIHQALASARLATSDVDAVEAHGTGTTLGDPIEAQALLATYGQDRPENRPLWLGSIKSNLGHTQAAAGVAGIIKMVMAMTHGVLPRTLHVDAPSPHVDWSSGAVELLTDAHPWPETGRPRRAAVSSFGISGTNAHVILEQSPTVVGETAETTPDTSEPAPADSPRPWVLSARTETALRTQAARLRKQLEAAPQLDVADVAYSLVTTRTGLEHRAVVIGHNREELLSGLEALAEGRPTVVEGMAGDPGKTVFVFPGQGSQWPGMAAELWTSSTAFRERMQACADALAPYITWSLVDVARGEATDLDLDRVDVIQPVLWAVMVSLAELWRSAGVEPDAVVGHSQGEIAAACVAGGLSLEDGARVVALRSQALMALAGRGGMVSLAMTSAEAEQLLPRWDGRISVAAMNGPRSTVVSGDASALAELLAHCDSLGVRARQVPVDYASHSPQVEAIQQRLARELADLSPRPGTLAFYSTVTGRFADTTELTGDYWYRNLRETVRFEPAVRELVDRGFGAFIEVSPHPVLTVGMQETLDDTHPDAQHVIVGSLRRDEGGLHRLLVSAAEAYVCGVVVDWSWTWADRSPHVVELPTYPFQRRRFWLEGRGSSDVAAAGLGRVDHPLLTARVELTDPQGLVLTGRWSLESHPWFADHMVLDTVVVPGTAFLELAVCAGAEAGCRRIEELLQQAPLILPEQGAVQVQVRVGSADDDGSRSLGVYSRREDVPTEEPWVCHARGVLGVEAPAPVQEAGGTWPPPGALPLDLTGFYERLYEIGLDYGPTFRGLHAAWQLGDEIFAEAVLPGDDRAETGGYHAHPALLDAALHSCLLRTAKEGQDQVHMPFAWNGVTVHATSGPAVRVRVSPAGSENVSVVVVDDAGTPVATIRSLAARPVSADHLRGPQDPGDSLFRLAWTRFPTTSAGLSGRWAVLGTGSLATIAATELAAAAIFPDLSSLRAALESGAATPDVILAPLAASVGTGTGDADLARSMTCQVLDLVQSWLADDRLGATRLVVVTRGAVSGSDEDGAAEPAGAAVWGLLRSAQAENPARFVVVDLDEHPESLAALPAALAADEPQLLIRAGRVLVPRLTRGATEGTLVPPAGVREWRLDSSSRGTLDNLVLAPCPEVAEPLASGQVRIAVRAAGLNFRDVVLALGMVPDRRPLGGEISGVVTEVGPDVTGLAAGDRVLGLAAGGLGPIAVTDHRMIVPIPDGWSFAEAASVPIAFLTAYYGLVELAGLRSGESVLIHAAAGGVGMAAVQLARHLGAEVFATASPAKWETVRALGIPDNHIASSRTAEFEEQFRAVTGEGGIDVVLNSLARDLVDASLRLQVPGGRFVEMGKTDIRDADEVASRHAGVGYHAFDLLDAGPERIGRMLVDILAMFERGQLRQIPVATWDIRRGSAAFRYLAQSRHVGKIVLTMPPTWEPEGSALVTGATGLLGAAVARNLVVSHGVRHLVLASRRGPDADRAAELEEELMASGARSVRVVACDVSDRAAVTELLASVPAEHPLTAVVHAAGVLDDGIVESLTPERIDAVFRPKVDAAVHLDELTRELDLAAFVVFSSAAATLGGAGQGNYAAANAFLDALVRRRREQGLAGISLAWGLWAESSTMTAGMGQADRTRLARSGLEALSTTDGLALFDAALTTDEPLLLPMRLDTSVLRASSASLPPVLRGLVRAPAGRTSGAAPGGATVRERLTTMSSSEQERLLSDVVRAEVAAVLGHATPDDVGRDRAFKELGFDSLTAVELRNRLNRITGLRLPATLVFDHPTPTSLAQHLRTVLVPEAPERAAHGEAEVRDALAAIPLARLREAGLLDALLELAGRPVETATPTDTGESVSIDEMDTEGLLAMALNNGTTSLFDEENHYDRQ
ncbi:type I polyketide synthase [Nocardia terpenica]|uniref:type I polyketide synthase n=1 Tax=Nocardia terpenica TaxID=455432 RepID=UPI0019347F82|nr:type I polyketide synthase [Nocardia terpenica]